VFESTALELTYRAVKDLDIQTKAQNLHLYKLQESLSRLEDKNSQLSAQVNELKDAIESQNQTLNSIKSLSLRLMRVVYNRLTGLFR